MIAYDRDSTLWDAARLLSVGEEGYSYRASVGARVRALPEFKEISEFFTAELSAQLADARSTTTAKLDAPVNKLARLLNSPSIKRVLLNESLTLDFDRVIADCEVVVVKGALGAMGAGNTSVLMQLLVGMLDAALARQQDLVPVEHRVAVALKIDEAPLVINRGFAETMALKRSAGLETVACWQADSQWTEREVRDQLDALFAHRVYFATASVSDARSASTLTMAEFSDTVRPGVERLSSLGRPDVRLHLPKHHAIASWVTRAGRQPPFIAETIPPVVDRQRLEQHAARQRERGARYRTDLSQPHWDRRRGDTDPGRAPSVPPPEPAPMPEPTPAPGPTPTPRPSGAPASTRASAPTPAPAAARPLPALLERNVEARDATASRGPAESFAELVELDGAHSVRWAKPIASTLTLELDQLDVAMLELIAAMRHVLTSQLHRRFNATRAATTTQRRLKRLSDAAMVERFQFHRRDGGGIPMCYVIADQGVRALAAHGREPTIAGRHESVAVAAGSSGGRRDDGRLRQARHDVHVAGWALALAGALGEAGSTLRGPETSTLSPPSRAAGEARVTLTPRELRLPGGRTPHDFLRTDASGQRVELERFETLRPDAIVAIAGAERSGPATDVIVELDDRPAVGRDARKLERYDHFLAGWSLHTPRYGRRAEALPVVVFVCRDRARARQCARHADSVLRACRAYAGEYPLHWEYSGRERIVFVAERDVHEGLLRAYGVPRMPPDVRVMAAQGDPRARETTVESRQILTGALAAVEQATP